MSIPRFHGMSRRRLLQGTAAGMALSPFVPRLEAFAQAGGPPRRLLYLSSHDGVTSNVGDAGGAKFRTGVTQFAGLTAPPANLYGHPYWPLVAIKNDVVVVDGLRNTFGGAHKSPCRMLTGVQAATSGGDDIAGGPSLDYVIGKRLGNATPVPQVYFAAMSFDAATNPLPPKFLSASGSQAPIQPETDPARAFSKYFAAFKAPSGAATDPAQPDAAQKLRAAEDRSVLDHVGRDLARLSRQVGSADRMRLDAHLANLRDLEKQLAARASFPVPGSGRAGAACSAPANPGPMASTIATFPDRWQAFARIVTSLLACDMTRVAVLQFSNSHQEGSGSTDWVSFAGVKGHSWHHVSHNDAVGQMALQSAYMQTMFVPLVKALQGIKDVDGSSLLDSTLVAWQTEFITGDDHSGAYIPTVLAGGNKMWKTGTTVKVADGTPQNSALVSVLRFMGFPDASFGSAGTGPLPGLG